MSDHIHNSAKPMPHLLLARIHECPHCGHETQQRRVNRTTWQCQACSKYVDGK